LGQIALEEECGKSCRLHDTMKKGDGTDKIAKLFRRAAPDVYWYYHFSGLLHAWRKNPFIRQSQRCAPQWLTMTLICDGQRFVAGRYCPSKAILDAGDNPL
jgi:hypothetical protein